MRKRYKIKHMLFYQESLTYDEFVAARALMRGMPSISSDKVAFGQWIDRMIEAKVLPNLVSVILKPYEPTILQKLWNRFWAWHAGLKRGDLGSIISTDPVFAGVARDFFLLNVSWLEMWLETPLGSEFHWQEMTPRQILSSLRSYGTSLLAAASSAPKE
jgi:hypothetical protein